MADKIFYTVKDYLGNPTSVPADKVEAFLTRQDALRAKVERGEEIKPDPELAEAVMSAVLARIKKAQEATGQSK